MSWTRRAFLNGLLASTVAAAGYGLPSGVRRVAAQERPKLPAQIGQGKSVAVIGAGIAGLTSAFELLGAGFDVTIYEASDRYGGRSLTVRPSDADYKAWYLANSRFVDADAYYDSIPAEVRGPMVPEQTARFTPVRVGDGYFDTYLNCGPGRIPTIHTGILHYCREFDVPLEPFIFIGGTNRFQADAFNEGRPVEFRRFLYEMQGYVSQMLYGTSEAAATVIRRNDATAIADRLRSFLVQFGDLQSGGAFAGTTRTGFALTPGAGTNAGIPLEPLALEQLLDAYDLWPNLLAGQHVKWQFPLVQPVGGMDLIWHAFLEQKPAQSVLRDHVRLSHEVTGLRYADQASVRVTVSYTAPSGQGEAEFDYVVLTCMPHFVGELAMEGLIGDGVKDAVDAVLYERAGKYGWQARRRFWEDPDVGILGGISWSEHMAQQIWYPSDGYNGPTGTLTGAYPWDRSPTDVAGRHYPADQDYRIAVDPEDLPRNHRYASLWGELDHAERTRQALLNGEKLHPGFTENVYADAGLSIAWQNQPFQIAMNVANIPKTRPQAYARLIQPIDRTGHVYVAGDSCSYWEGWMEGAVRSAWWTLGQIRDHVVANGG